jgi:hypothetical protein
LKTVSNSDALASSNAVPSKNAVSSNASASTGISANLAPANLPEDLAELTQVVQAAAQRREGDCLALLALLRLLNDLHAEIRDTLFREALPDNRQRLYRLLKDIEQEGGWPYIQRTKLLALLQNIEEAAENSLDPNDAIADSSTDTRTEKS